MCLLCLIAVSYTHLDVYKRQVLGRGLGLKIVETLTGLVQNMASSSSTSKHDKFGITETANSNNKMNNKVNIK